jgi:hypothetical protein
MRWIVLAAALAATASASSGTWALTGQSPNTGRIILACHGKDSYAGNAMVSVTIDGFTIMVGNYLPERIWNDKNFVDDDTVLFFGSGHVNGSSHLEGTLDRVTGRIHFVFPPRYYFFDGVCHKSEKLF